MQHIQSVKTAFHTAVRWNTIGYITQRILNTAISVYLYYNLSSADYVTWNTLLSVIFISIFFCDAGLRRSVPLYINTQRMRKWVIPIYGAIACILAIAIFTARAWIIPYHAQHITSYLIIPFVIIHTIRTGIRIVYNAQLHNKRFAIINSAWTGIEAICMYIGLRICHTYPIHMLIAAKNIGGIGALVHTWMRTPTIQNNHGDDATVNHITRHTGFVWGVAIARSLSERHIIMPLIAWTAPASIAATYKVLYDTVMLVYRTIIKAVDINDITILRHEKTRRFAFFHISTTIVNWISIAIIMLASAPYVMTTAAMHRGMFSILSITTLLELPMIPCERICEIRHNYMILLCVYVIACITPMCFLICTPFHITTYSHVMVLLLVIHGVRTSMLWILGLVAPHEIDMQYPWRYVTLLLSIALAVNGVCIYHAP